MGDHRRRGPTSHKAGPERYLSLHRGDLGTHGHRHSPNTHGHSVKGTTHRKFRKHPSPKGSRCFYLRYCGGGQALRENALAAFPVLKRRR